MVQNSRPVSTRPVSTRPVSASIALGLVAATVLTGCVAGPGGGSTALPDELAWILDDAEPIAVTPVVDEATASTALVTIADGGVVTATGADGTVFTLTVPAEAVRYDVEITMTPLLSIDALPFGGDGTALAVQLEPSGLQLDAFATLDIESPQAPPLSEQVLFSYEGTGERLALALPDLESDGIRILLDHFSGYGVGNGFLTDISAIRARLGGSTEARISSEVAALMQGERDGALSGGAFDRAELDPLFTALEEQVLKPRIASAGESCANGVLAIQTASNYVRNRQLLGEQEFSLDSLGLSQPFAAAARACLEEEYDLCKVNHIVHRMIPVWRGFEQTLEILKLDEEFAAVVAEAEQKVRDCLTFSVEFASTVDSLVDEVRTVSSVEGEVEFSYDPQGLRFMSEKVTLTNTAFDLTLDGCSFTETTGDGTFEVADMFLYPTEFDMSPPDDGREPRVGTIDKVELQLAFGLTSESAVQTCFGFSLAYPPTPWWTTLANEVSGVSLSQITDWQIIGLSEFATTQWSRSGATGTEQGNAILTHLPK